MEVSSLLFGEITEKRNYYFKNVEKMNQNGLTANTTTLNETTGNSTGSDYPEDSCSPLNGNDSGGTNVLLYSVW